MNKFIVYIFGFFLLAQVNALACNFKKTNFGSPKESVKIGELIPVVMSNRFGGEELIIPIQELCKNDKNLYGTSVIHLYIENKLNRIQLYRPNMEDSKLMDYAMGKYGSFNLPEGVPKSRWRGSYVWESGNDSIEYIKIDIHDGHAEIINIVSKLYSVGMADYNSKVGEWLDSQQ